MSSEETESTKNMISMKSVIVGMAILGGTAVSILLLGQMDQRRIPVNVIVMDTVISGVLTKYIQNPTIKEFFLRKLSQKKRPT